jgi:ribonucleoside-diphosphate reductase beta chain
MSIFEQTEYLDPEYQLLEKYVGIMYRGFWTPAKYEKLIAEQDTPHYFNNTSAVDQEAIKRCILAVSLVEDKVKVFWPSLHFDLPQTIVSDIGALFGMSETTHRRSYHSLLENLKINPQEIHEHPVLEDRVAYLTKYLEKDPKIVGKKRILKKLILFTTLVERVSLFTQFYILMSFAKANHGLKTISSLQQTTATEEMVHYSCGMDLVNIIKRQHPNLWDEHLVELVEKNLQQAYDAEIKLIDWFFEKGVPSHLMKEEVVNFLRFNFYEICKDLKLDQIFDYNEELYEARSKWFMEKVKTAGEPDFFDCPAGGYASEDIEINLDNFTF